MKIAAVTAVVLICVTTVFALEEKQWIDYRMVSEQTSLFHKDQPLGVENIHCNNVGLVCDDDCKRRWVCSSSTGFYPGLIGTCTGDETCNAGFCSSTPTPACSPAASKPFVCLAEGVFPDHTTCKKYHHCIKNGEDFVDNPRTCGMHYGYNPGNTYCSKSLTNNQCGAEYPVPICTTHGQNSALKDNKSIYYVCLDYIDYNNTENILYPYLYLCPNGQQYYSNYGCK